MNDKGAEIHLSLMMLDTIRTEMMRMFIRVTRTPQHDAETQRFIELQDEHQEQLAKIAKIIG